MIVTRSSLLALILAAPLFAEQPMTDRITPAQLSAKTQENPILALKQQKTPDEAKVKNAADQTLLGSSDILSDGTHWTLVPKGAVLHTPASLKSKVGVEPAGQLLTWTDFLAANRSWLSGEEISYEQAAGKAPLQPDRAGFWPKQGKVVVAVHLGGPISFRTTPL